jgi:hypothetical protein
MASQARAGDRFVIVVKQVQRMNFKGERETVPTGEVIKQLPLN